jgi:integrase/recombinase XerC
MKNDTASIGTLRHLPVLHTEYVNELRKQNPETRGTYERTLREFMRWLHNEKNFQFTSGDIERYKKYLFKQKKLTHTSVVMYLSSVRKFCDYLMARGVLKKNPARGVRGGTPPIHHTRTSISSEYMLKFLQAIERNTEIGYRDFAVAKLMIGLGLSEIELVRADIADLTIARKKMELQLQGKGKKVKDSTVILSGDVFAAMKAYMIFRSGSKPGDPLFMSAGNRTRGSRMTSRGIRERINFYFNKAGIKNGEAGKVTALSLRLTAIKTLAQKGVPVSDIQNIFRIKKASTVELYLKEIQ